jgi:hypothetical protein
LRGSPRESIEESAAKFEGEVGRWEEEILKWAYKLAQLMTEALLLQPQFCGQISAPSMSSRGRECRSNLHRGERIMRLLRFARNDSKGWLAMTVSVTSPTKVKQIPRSRLSCNPREGVVY